MSEDRRRGRQSDDGAADFADALAEMGLSFRTSWYSSAVLYGVGGSLIALVYLIDPASMPRAVFYCGCVAIVIAALSLWGARRLVGRSAAQERLTHARLIGGLVIYITAAIVLAQRANAFALFPLLTIPTPCFLYTTRFAIPYPVVAALISLIGLLLTSRPATTAHAVITAAVILLTAAGILITKGRTRTLAVRNRRLANSDPLTGLANVRSLRERMAAELGRRGRSGSPFALFAIDLDDFKQVNDRFDHSVGDAVLCAVANALGDELERGDLVARRGGDEFSVLVPEPETRDLDDMRKRLEDAIERARLTICPAVTPTGTAAYILTRADEEVGAMMERADQVLHDAKIASRERRRGSAAGSAPRGAPLAGHDGPVAAVPIASSDDKPDDESARGARPSPRRRLAAAFVNAVARGDLTWRLAALLLAANGGLIAVVSIAGLVEPLTLAEGAAVAGGNVALALGCLWAGTAGLPEKWLHAPWVVAYALIATAIALSRGSGVALLDLLPLMAMYGFVMFGPRTAAIYMVGAQAAYGVFAISGGYFQGALRTGITTVVAAEVGLLIGKLRQLTVQFARANRELSEVDELTGVANWRALKSRVTEVMSRASSQQLHPWLVAIDLDGFKQVNDMHCHSTGDRVLIAVARAISDSVRVDELVARRGGDEFVVVVEDGHAAHTEAIVRRITDAIARARARVCPDVTPTACVACVACKSGGTPDALLREADLALHREKAAAHRLAAAQRPLVSGGPAASTLRGDQ